MSKKISNAENASLDDTVQRVKKDLLKIALCTTVSVIAGLIVGSMIKL